MSAATSDDGWEDRDVRLERTGEERDRLCDLIPLVCDAAGPVEDGGAIGCIEVRRLHDRIGLHEQCGGDVEPALVHLRPRRSEAMTERQGRVVVHVVPQSGELRQSRDMLIVPREVLGAAQPCLDVRTEEDGEDRGR